MRIVYLTEERPATFKAALKRAGLLDCQNFRLACFHEMLSVPWETKVRLATQECLDWGADILVVDTISQFAQLPGDGENTAGAVLKMYEPLQRAAAQGLAVIVVRHERKSGGDAAVSGRGSSAFTGAADIVISIRRAEGHARPSVRQLTAISRYEETPEALTIDRRKGRYRITDGAAVAEEEAENGILAYAPQGEANAVTEEKLLKDAGVKRTIGQKAIKKLVDSGHLQRSGRGAKGNPYRYWMPPIHSAETRSVDAAE